MITLTDGKTTRVAPTGFSFTTFFFGFFPVLFRGDVKMAGALFGFWLLSLIPFIGLIFIPAFFIAPAVVNRIYIARLQARGFAGGPDMQAEVFPLQPGEGSAALTAFLVMVVVFVVAVILGAAVGFAVAGLE